MRSLSPEEAQLWARVAATIRPLSRELPAELSPLSPETEAGTAPPGPGPLNAATKLGPGRAHAARAKPVPGTTLDGTWDRRLKSGTVEPDRVLDLHGYNLDGAWAAIDLALERALAGGERVVLLITGHERRGAPPVERGKIRAAVHDWLAASRHSRDIAAVRGAHRRHGGGGSLYIILRRR